VGLVAHGLLKATFRGLSKMSIEAAAPPFSRNLARRQNKAARYAAIKNAAPITPMTFDQASSLWGAVTMRRARSFVSVSSPAKRLKRSLSVGVGVGGNTFRLARFERRGLGGSSDMEHSRVFRKAS
jgi:hypothetical protein